MFKTNATGNEELEAVISEVAPRATSVSAAAGSSSSSSVASYKVVMDVLSKNDNLRLDMSVKLNITVEEVQDVFAVSYEAIQTDEEGKTFIEVEEENAGMGDVALTENGAEALPTKKIYVTTGMEGDYYTEISSHELKEGMVVRIPANDMATDIDALISSSNGGM